METTNEPDTKKGKRPKSATRYPKRMPTYVVAFAVQESHDDPTKQQQVHKKRSVHNSTHSIKSISPSGSISSAKTFTITPTEKDSNVLDVPTISEVKIDILDENQCGDVEKKSLQISSYIVADNRTADEQPEIIFNATKHIKRSKENSNKFPRKKPRKNKRIIKFKNVHFKYKNPKNNLTRRLEKYYEKAKINLANAEQIQKQIYSNGLSKVVSRSRVLKKVLAKENLLDGTDRVSFYDGLSIYDDGSLDSSPSTTKKSYVSYASQNTLIRKSSSSSRNEDFYSIKAVNSVIQVASDITPYKTDVINVAMAVAYSSSKPNTNQNSSISNEILLHQVNLTSDESFLQPRTELTSETPSKDIPYTIIDYDQLNPINLNEKEESHGTLTYEKKSLLGVSSDDDTFVIARTSSDFNKSSINSDFTLTFNSDTTIHAETPCINPNFVRIDDFVQNNAGKRATLLDTVINLGFYPEMTPSTSSGANYDSDVNDVIVTENLTKNYSLSPKNLDDEDMSMDVKKNLSSILKKSFDLENISLPQRNISLPNEITIKAKLKEAEKGIKRTCFEDIKSKYPTDLSEMWERLTQVLDLAVKRLEETLAEKIVKDLKTSLAFLTHHDYKLPMLGIQPTQTKPKKAETEPSTPMTEPPTVIIEQPAVIIEPPAVKIEPPTAIIEPPTAIIEPPTAIIEPPTAITEPPTAIIEPPTAIIEPPTAIIGPPTAIIEPPTAITEPPTPITIPPTAITVLHKEVYVLQEHLSVEADECIQCDLVGNQVIDQLMLKLSVEGPKPAPISDESLKKLKKPQIVKDYFEIIKPPAVDTSLIEVRRGDTVTVATATPELRTEEFDGFTRLKLLLSGPVAFIRENLFIITSVPTFFIVLFCLYGIIVLIMKPW